MIRFPCVFVITGLFVMSVAPAVGDDKGACALLDPQEVSTAIGLPVMNVVERDRGSFTSCSFETDDWMQTAGLIHFPELGATTAEKLAAEIRADMDRDGVEYADFGIEAGFDVPAVYYRSPEGDRHTVVVQAGGNRLIISAGTRDAVFSLAQTAVHALEE